MILSCLLMIFHVLSMILIIFQDFSCLIQNLEWFLILVYSKNINVFQRFWWFFQDFSRYFWFNSSLIVVYSKNVYFFFWYWWFFQDFSCFFSRLLPFFTILLCFSHIFHQTIKLLPYCTIFKSENISNKNKNNNNKFVTCWTTYMRKRSKIGSKKSVWNSK